MLCGLGAVVFATVAGTRQRTWGLASLLFVALAAWSVGVALPPAELVGCAAGLGAAALLLRPSWSTAAGGLAGALAGIWSGVLTGQGLPPWIAVPAALAPPAVALIGRRRPAFAPERVREEALLLVCVLGLCVAMLPGVLDGWRAAQSLTVQPADVQDRVIPGWALLMTGISLALGAGYALWSRR
jgi:hypothetical protein